MYIFLTTQDIIYRCNYETKRFKSKERLLAFNITFPLYRGKKKQIMITFIPNYQDPLSSFDHETPDVIVA